MELLLPTVYELAATYLSRKVDSYVLRTMEVELEGALRALVDSGALPDVAWPEVEVVLDRVAMRAGVRWAESAREPHPKEDSRGPE